MKSKALLIQDIKNKNDEYLNTVYAIIGFLNEYKFQLRKAQKDVVIFQGRKLFSDTKKEIFCTPDFGLVISNTNGVIGEVKYSFPADKKHWEEVFEQIYKYCNSTFGWPTINGKVNEYDIVLLVHQSRSRDVVDYFNKTLKQDLKPTNNFIIVEFNRSSQGKEYFHFRIELGTLSEKTVHERIYKGLEVPMEVYVTYYSRIQIYDTEPHVSFLMYLIYLCILDKSKGEGTFKKLTKKQKVIIDTSVKEITHLLRTAYSFQSLQNTDNTYGQPENPKQDWVRNAIDKLSSIGEVNWVNRSDGSFQYILSYKEGNILDYYIENCVDESAKQIELF